LRVFFDQGTPVPLRNLLDSHQVETAYERGWNQLTNGNLLAEVAREGFQIFVTTDKNMTQQQNLDAIPFAIIVLSTTSWPRIQPAFIQVLQAIDNAIPGIVTSVTIP
tara:strand:+ start:118 stop:438 length:321 start_codon:yes stop_codon:yes gene_type:complete